MRERARPDTPIAVVPCTPEHYETFSRLNYEWIDRYFGVEAAIATARASGASRLVLQSNTVLGPAMALYRKLGFVEVHGAPSLYARSNIHMELQL
jgi:hypothetical protein